MTFLIFLNIMNKPLFSIIIPTYNHAHLIKKCLDSVVAQTINDWEAIVINNFSQDNTIEVVQSYMDTRIRLINNLNDGIIAVSRNKGLLEARGEWICFLDSDDWWTNNKLESCLPFLENYDYLYHDMEIVYEKSSERKQLKGRSLNVDKPYLDMLLHGNPCINSSAVVRHTILQEIGLIDENPKLIAVEDFDYWLRIVQRTKRCMHIPRVLGYYWVGGTSISFNEKQIIRIDALYEKHISNVQQSKLVDEILSRMAYRQARIYQLLGLKKEALSKFRKAMGSRDFYTVIRAILFTTIIKLGLNGKKRM